MRVGGDVIVAVEGRSVRSFDDLVTYLARYTEVGQTINLRILRGAQEQTVSLTLAARPQAQSSQPEAQTEGMAYLGILGLSVTPQLARAMDLPADQTGVLVEQVQQDSPADRAGLQGSYQQVMINGQQVMVGGDIIVAWDGQPIIDFGDLLSFLQRAEPGQEVTLTLLRESNRIDVDVVLSERPASMR